MAKKKAGKKSGKRQFAAATDVATFDTPSSRQAAAAVLKAAPLDVAKDEVQTMSARLFDDGHGGTITAYPKRREVNGTELAESECPNGHKAGDGEVTVGTLGKTATCSECGELLEAKVYLDARDGTELTVKREKPKKGAEGESDRVTASRNESTTPKADEGREGEETITHAERRAGRPARRKAAAARRKRPTRKSAGARKSTGAKAGEKEAAEV